MKSNSCFKNINPKYFSCETHVVTQLKENTCLKTISNKRFCTKFHIRNLIGINVSPLSNKPLALSSGDLLFHKYVVFLFEDSRDSFGG